MARAIGIHGIRIENSADLPGGIAAALEHPGPVLVDVVTDPLELVMPPKITLEQVKGFSIWMMKAVLNGRGNELVELARNALDR
jgi:pyruvate dehydrogenase (quinone)